MAAARVLEVYLDLLSQPCRALHILLTCTRIPHTVRTVALRKGEHRAPGTGHRGTDRVTDRGTDRGLITRCCQQLLTSCCSSAVTFPPVNFDPDPRGSEKLRELPVSNGKGV